MLWFVVWIQDTLQDSRYASVCSMDTDMLLSVACRAQWIGFNRKVFGSWYLWKHILGHFSKYARSIIHVYVSNKRLTTKGKYIKKVIQLVIHSLLFRSLVFVICIVILLNLMLEQDCSTRGWSKLGNTGLAYVYDTFDMFKICKFLIL